MTLPPRPAKLMVGVDHDGIAKHRAAVREVDWRAMWTGEPDRRSLPRRIGILLAMLAVIGIFTGVMT